MAGVVFSKLSGKNDSLFKAVEGLITEIISDVDTGKSKDKEVLRAIFNLRSSKKFGERYGGMTEFSNFSIVPEGDRAVVDELEEGFAKLISHHAFLKGFTITREMMDDGRLDDMRLVAKNFMKAYERSRLEFATAFLSAEGKTFQYMGKTLDRTTGDGVGLFATDHAGKKAGVATQSNVFTNPLGTDIGVLNHLANYGRNFKNASGNALGYTFDTLIIPGNTPKLEETANRIIYTGNGAVGTELNDINTQKGKWRLIVNHRWEAKDGQEPFIMLSKEANEALMSPMFYDRIKLDVQNEIESSTRNFNWTGYSRFAVGAFDWRAVIMGGAQLGSTITP